MQRRAHHTPDPADATRLVLHGAPRLLRLRWWLLAPALLVVVSVVGAFYWRTRYDVYFDDPPAPAMARIHETPWFLWLADGPDDPLVSTSPGGAPVTGTWTAIDEAMLVGNWVLADDAGDAEFVAWVGGPTTFIENLDGVLWREFVRRPVRADFEALGHDPEFVGSWHMELTEMGCGQIWMGDLLPGGTTRRLLGSGGQWAGAGRLILLAESYSRRRLRLEVFVENPRSAEELGVERWYGAPFAFDRSLSIWRDRD